MEDIRSDDVGMQPEAGSAERTPRELLAQDRGIEEVAASTTVFGWYTRAEKTRHARLPPELAAHLAVLLPLGVVGCHLVLDEAPDGGTEYLVLFPAKRPRH